MSIMEKVPGDTVETPIWDEFRKIIAKYDSRKEVIAGVERFAFYEKAKDAFVTVCTSERQPYGCIILQKGVM